MNSKFFDCSAPYHADTRISKRGSPFGDGFSFSELLRRGK